MGKCTAEIQGCFRRVAGMERVYDPTVRTGESLQKHPCKDCAFCQRCSDTRCTACRGGKDAISGRTATGLSIKEQIALYERLNSSKGLPDRTDGEVA